MRKLVLFLVLPVLAACDGAGSAERAVLVEAVRGKGGLSVEGHESSVLCDLAMEHANAMASAGAISHDGFSDRAAKIFQANGSNPGEIVASNSQADLNAAAAQCAESWRNSPGHWEIMSQRYDAYCYAMVKGGSSYYCIGLVANGL